MIKNNKSVEPNIADLANGWLKSYGLDYKLEQQKKQKERLLASGDRSDFNL